MCVYEFLFALFACCFLCDMFSPMVCDICSISLLLEQHAGEKAAFSAQIRE